MNRVFSSQVGNGRIASSTISGHRLAESSVRTASIVRVLLGFGIVVALLLISSEAKAHEAWLLTPLQMLDLFQRPLAWVWQDVTLFSLTIALVLLLGMVLAEYLDGRFDHLKRSITDRNPRNRIRWALVVLRYSLGLLMIFAALGLNPRAGTAPLSEPTLFVSDLELGAVTELALPIAGLQLVLGVALIFGIYVGFASLLTIVLVGIGFYLFGIQVMLSYAGQVVPPALVLLLYSGSEFARWRPLSRVRHAPAGSHPSISALGRIDLLLRVPTGLTFMYLAVTDKYLNSPLFEQIIRDHDMPTFGIPPELLVFIMFAIEIAGGLALVLGIVERFVALVFIGAMMFFAVMLGESPLIHANIIGILFAVIILAPKNTPSDRSIASSGRLTLSQSLRLGTASVLCGLIAFSSVWVGDLRAALPAADVRLVYARGPAAEQPQLRDVAVEPLGDRFYRLRIAADNFRFTTDPQAMNADYFDGHAHVYVDGNKLMTLYAPTGIIGPLPEDATDIVVSLMNPNHCFVATENGMLTRRIELPERIDDTSTSDLTS